MPDSIAIGFIGFGEAGFIIAKGLRESGIERIFFTHGHRRDPKRASLAAQRGREAGAAALETAEELAGRADYLLSVVPPDAALAAHHFRVEETVLKVLNDQFFGRGLEYVVDGLVGSDAVYAGRRAVEMEASQRLLEQLGIDPLMVRATVERLKWSASLGLSAKFDGVAPTGYREVIRAWEEIGLFRKHEQ